MKKSSKTILTGAAAVGAIAAGATAVNADNVQAANSNTNQDSAQKQQVATDQVSKVATNHDAEVASTSKVNAIKSSISQQQKVVQQAEKQQQADQQVVHQNDQKIASLNSQKTDAQKQVATAQQAVDQAKQDIANDQTPQMQQASSQVQTAQQAVQNQQQKVANDQASVAQHQAAVASTQKQIDQQQQKIQNDQQNVEQAKQAINDAQTKVNEANQAAQQQQAAIDNAQKNVNAKQDAVKQAQTAVDQAQQKVANDQAQAKQTAKNNPQVAQAQQALDQANAKVQSDQAYLAKVQDTYKQDQQKMNDQLQGNTQLGTPWLSSYANNGETNPDNSVFKNGLVGVATPEQEKEWDNGVQLTQDQQTILDQLNLQRIAHGVAPVKIDSNLQSLAQERAGQLKSNFNHTGDFSNIAFNHGYDNASENIACGYSPQQVVNGWNSEPTNQYNHRWNDFDPKYTNVGVGYQNGYAILDFAGHDWYPDYKGLDDKQIWTGGNSVKAVPMPVNNDSIKQNWKAKLDEDQQSIASSQRQLEIDKDTAKNAQTALNMAMQDAAPSSNINLTKDQAALTQAQKQLADANQALKDAQAQLTRLKQHKSGAVDSNAVMNAQQAYQKACDQLTIDQNGLTKLNDALKQEQAAIKTAQANLTTDQATLATLQGKLADAQHTYDALAKQHHVAPALQNKLIAAQNKLDRANTALADLNKQINDVQKNQTEALARLSSDAQDVLLSNNKLKQLEQQLKDAENASKIEADNAKRQDANKQHVDFNNNPLPNGASIDSSNNIVTSTGDIIGHNGILNDAHKHVSNTAAINDDHVTLNNGKHTNHEVTIDMPDMTAKHDATHVKNNMQPTATNVATVSSKPAANDIQSKVSPTDTHQNTSVAHVTDHNTPVATKHQSATQDASEVTHDRENIVKADVVPEHASTTKKHVRHTSHVAKRTTTSHAKSNKNELPQEGDTARLEAQAGAGLMAAIAAAGIHMRRRKHAKH